jgi:hypothetical protein
MLFCHIKLLYTKSPIAARATTIPPAACCPALPAPVTCVTRADVVDDRLKAEEVVAFVKFVPEAPETDFDDETERDERKAEDPAAPVTAAPAGMVMVLKLAGKTTPLFWAQVAGSRPSGQQYPFVKQKLVLGQASSGI